MTSQHTVFETKRLLIRAATEEDVDLLYELWTDPRVMSYVGFPQGLQTTREKIRQQVRGPYESEFGRVLVVVLKTIGQAIGECAMKLPDEEGIAETDVKLLPAFWGHRYGTEVKHGLVGHLFSHTSCIAVGASPNVENIASIKMQEAVGAVRIAEHIYEFPESMRDYTTPVHHYIYHVYREGWEQEQSDG
jgi:RimJ/RimL family protein N-acetyltransferase